MNNEQVKQSMGVSAKAIVAKQDGLVLQYSPEQVVKSIDSAFHGLTPTVLQQLSSGKVSFSELALRDKGCVFGTIKVNKDLGKSSMKATHRTTGEINPFVATGRGKNKTMPTRKAFEQYSVQVMLNIIWDNSIDNTREATSGIDTGFKSQGFRQNGIQNVGESRVVCQKTVQDEQRYYLNYIVFRYLEDRKIVDENGQELDQNWMKGFADKTDEQVRESREREADKHGIAVEFDPQIRQMRIDNMAEIRVFGTTYAVIQ